MVLVFTLAMSNSDHQPTSRPARYGRSRNPHGLHLSPGGSSGGTAALVAALGAPVALTADIGGSTRIPALLNGLLLGCGTGVPNRNLQKKDYKDYRRLEVINGLSWFFHQYGGGRDSMGFPNVTPMFEMS